MRTAFVLASLTTVLLAGGCSISSTRVGDHDGSDRDAGSLPGCGSAADCSPGNQCVCERCISLDLPAPACDPPCSTASHGDFCTEEGRTCPGECSALVCTAGSFVTESFGCDAGPAADGGWCECPAPPPGCHYDGAPCPCSHLTCEVEHCGREVCSPGTTCCNASCGICAPPDASCIDLACAPDCSPQDAHSNGRCSLSAGWAWDGAACRELSCSCIGADCDDVFSSYAACDAYFSACAGATCGTIAGLGCGSGAYCDYEDSSWCGGDDGGGVCRAIPTDCPPEIRPTCGCDGATYASPCDANASGTDVAYGGACDDCTADDVTALGDCDAEIGYAFTSRGCMPISGCDCAGTDCELVRGRSESECNRAHTACPILLD